MSFHPAKQVSGPNITQKSNLLIAFGGGNGFDILIKDRCNEIDQNQSCIGKVFKAPFETQDKKYESETYLAGARRFMVEEIEVYSVTKIAI